MILFAEMTGISELDSVEAMLEVDFEVYPPDRSVNLPGGVSIFSVKTEDGREWYGELPDEWFMRAEDEIAVNIGLV